MAERERPTLISFENFIGDPDARDPHGWRLLIAGLMAEASKDTAKAYYLILKTEVTPEQWDEVVRRALASAHKGGPAWFPKPGYLQELAWEVKQEILDRRALTAGGPSAPATDEEIAQGLEIFRKALADRGQDPMSIVRPMPKATKAKRERQSVDAAREEEQRQRNAEKHAEAVRRFGKASA